MRAVAVLLALLALPAVMPASASSAYDQCTTGVASASACHAATTPPAADRVPGNTYYVFVGGRACTTAPTSGECLGGNSLVYGAVYQETNGLEGLQRTQVTVGSRTFPPDKPLVL